MVEKLYKSRITSILKGSRKFRKSEKMSKKPNTMMKTVDWLTHIDGFAKRNFSFVLDRFDILEVVCDWLTMAFLTAE